VTFLRVLADALRAASTEVEPVLREVGLTSSVLCDAQARIPLDVARRAWVVGAEHTGDPDFGLDVVQRLGGTTFELIEYLGRTADTVEESLTNVARFARLVSDASAITVERHGHEVRFVHHEPSAPRHFVELFFATIIVRLRELAGFEGGLVRVAFQHDAPASTDAHVRVFRAPLQFGHTEGALVFDDAVARRRLRSADRQLSAILTRHADEILARTPAPDDFVGSIQRAVESALARRRFADVDDIAHAHALSRRTLQRRLGEHATSFQRIVDEARRRLALHLVGDRRLPASEVAWLVGFAGANVFHRAFKRWTGTTPAAYALRSR
jgi:AraC-like DNA-binding protein